MKSITKAASTLIFLMGMIALVTFVGLWQLRENNEATLERIDNELPQLEQIQTDEPIILDDSGELVIEIEREGEGAEASAGDRVQVHYTGILDDGTKFDSSLDRGEPFEFDLGANQVIQGWEQGVAGMKVGEIRLLTIPPQLGYGARQTGSIPPNSTLNFEIELLAINE